MSELWLGLVTAAVIGVGVIGTVVPVIPGIGLIWIAALGWGLLTGFAGAGVFAMGFLTLLLVVGVFLGVRIPQRTATAEGLSAMGLVVGVILAIVGAIVLPVIGAAVGFVFGVWLLRYLDSRDASAAWRSSVRTIGALVTASAAQLVVATGMAIVWAAWALSA